MAEIEDWNDSLTIKISRFVQLLWCIFGRPTVRLCVCHSRSLARSLSLSPPMIHITRPRLNQSKDELSRHFIFQG